MQIVASAQGAQRNVATQAGARIQAQSIYATWLGFLAWSRHTERAENVSK